MSHCWFALLLVAVGLPVGVAGAAPSELSKCRQCIVALTDNWESTTGVLRVFERDTSNDGWKERDGVIPIVLGKNGLGRGRGLVNLELGGAADKKEGDNKTPAGVFRLSSAFGYAPTHSASWVKLPYLALSAQTEGIDDPRSRYYNRLVDRSRVAKVDWSSSERMLRNDVRYKWGIIVEHNPMALPGTGSCIFLHVWLNPSTLTTGCTAMSERDLVKLIRWLDPSRNPILVQMPRSVYDSIRAKWHLPSDDI